MLVCDRRMERRHRRARLTAIAAAAVILSISAPGIAHADFCTWTGNGTDNLWSTPANWTCTGPGSHVVPGNGDSVQFPMGAAQPQSVNDIAGLILAELGIDEGHQLSGAAVLLDGGVRGSRAATPTSMLVPLTVNQPNAYLMSGDMNNTPGSLAIGDIDLNTHGLEIRAQTQVVLELNGTITGDGGIVLTGLNTETVNFNNANDYTGITEVKSGILAANSDTALGAAGTGSHTVVNFGFIPMVGTVDGTLSVGPGRSIAEPLRIAGFGHNTLGAVRLESGTSTLTGDVYMTDDASIHVGAGAELRLTGPVTGVVTADLLKYGPGTLTVSNPANSWETLAISAGVLRLGASAALPDSAALSVSGTFDLNGFDDTIGSLFGTGIVAVGAGTLTVSQSTPADFDGVITGTGGLIKAGASQLTLGGAASNTFTGTTTVTAGQLHLAKLAATAIAGPLVINGGVVTNAYSNQIADTAAVSVYGSGVLSLSGGANSSEVIGSLAGNGTVTLSDHSLIVGANNQSTVFSGTIGGASAFLSKQGTGTLTLSGHNVTLDGATFISGGGGLIVNGTMSSSITINGGMIGGAGSIGAVNASGGFGNIAPGPGAGGVGTGILTTPTLTLGSAITAEFELNGAVPGAGYDRLAVANQVFLGNPTLYVTRGYVPAANTTFTIIDNASATPVAGVFNGLPQNALLFVDGHPFRISYTGGDGNDVVLTALAQPAFSISDVTVTEGESGSVNAVFTVSTPHAPFQTVSVQFATVNGTAASPQDFTAHSGTLTFLAGTTSQTVTVAVHGDDTAEATETFIVRLSGAQGGATIDDEDGVGTIETDDEAPAPLTYFLAEGATGPFFDNDVLIANPNAAAAPVTLTFFTDRGGVIAEQRTIAGESRVTIHVDQIQGLENTAVSVEVKSTNGVPLTVERTMFWDASYYGGHTGTAVEQPAQRWFFAEAAQGFFDTYVLVTNANPLPGEVTVTFLREGETPVVKTVPIGASSRATIGARDYPELDGRSFGLIVDATMPVIAERAMYFGTTPARLWSGGHGSPGVAQASTSWFHAEGAMGAFFDTFILLGNPQDDPAAVTLDFLLESGETITVQRDVPAKGRVTVPIEAENDPRLHSGAVAIVVTSDRPIVSERSTYWGGDAAPWGEGHNSFGLTQTATSWGLAEGRVGGTHQFATYILLANPSQTTAADVSVTYLLESGAPVVKTYQVPAGSRFTIDASTVAELLNQSFGAKIDVENGVAIAVERSMYWNANGVFWAGGSHAPAQRLP